MRKSNLYLAIIILCLLISTILLPKNTLALTIPTPPTNLTATAVSSGQINLTWAAVSGATSYYLYSSTSYYGTYSNITVLTSPSYSNTGLTPNTAYYYKVLAVNSAGSSGYSAIAYATTTNSYTVPTAPTNLTAMVASSSQINLTWDAISGATSYYLYRATSYYGTYSNIAQLSTPSYSNTGLAVNTAYYYKVQAVNSAGSSGYSAVAYATTTGSSSNSVPTTPTNFTAVVAGPTQINLAWNAASGAVSYHIYRATSYYGTYSNITVVTGTSYSDAGVTANGTYYYKVQAVNNFGSSDYSAIAYATTSGAYSVPPTPTNLLTTFAGPGQINLTWDAVSGATSYYLYRATSYYGNYSNIAMLNTSSYTDTGLAVNTTYYYKVQAVDSAGSSGYSAIASATTTNSYSIPSSPTNLVATVTGPNQINLTWDAVSGATNYYIYRSTTYYGNYTNIVVVTTPSYLNTGLAANSSYYYKVEAYNSAGPSGFSAITGATLNGSYSSGSVPSAPTNLTATVAGPNQINLAWDAVSGATSYYLYRSTSYYGTYSNINVLTTPSYADTGLTTNGTYYYEVQAVNSFGSSGYSAITNATTNGSYSSVPSTPTNLIATAANPSQINLTWNAVSGAVSYYIYRATSYSGTYSNITVVTSPSYVDTGLATNGTYYYKVQAANSFGSSGYAAIAYATTNGSYGVPSTPTNLIASVSGPSQINLTWDAASGATSYYLYRSTSYDGTYSNITVVTGTSYADTGLAANGTYYYKVQAVSSLGSSGYSAITYATTTGAYGAPAAPTNLTAAAAGSAQINLTWDAVSGATSYFLYRATSSSGTYANIVAVTTTGYVDTDLSAGTAYYYKVQAVNNVGSSSYSSEASATTESGGTSAPRIPSTRISGQDRYETAAKITKSGWKTSYYVVIASGDTFADALCGAPLATKYNAPILLSSKDSLDKQTMNQLVSLKAKKVFIIGGVGVISSSVEQAIKNMGIDVSRLAGSDRYETSLKVAQNMGDFNQAIIATGEDFPDALSIAPIAAMKGIPIILTPQDKLPKDIKNYLSKTVQSTYVLGGAGVVSANVLNQLPDPTRLSGQDRYETNLTIINKFSNELNFDNCYLATGENFPDALAGSALAALTNSPLILVSNPVGQATTDYINSKVGSIKSLTAFGGTDAVPDSILNIDSASNRSATPSVPAVPTNFTAAAASSSQVKLSWDSVNGATSYYVYGATSSSGTYTKIATVTTPSYTNTGLWAGTTYYYKVQSVNDAGSSSYSSVVSATTSS